VPWNGVRRRFSAFHSNLALTPDQVDEGERHYAGVLKTLYRHYYPDIHENGYDLLAGSWGKDLRTRPPRDIDVYFCLPVEIYFRFELRTGNRQSQLLQEVKGIIAKTYPTTNIKGDGPVVVVGFNRMSVEVVPSFLLANGQFRILISNDGGSYKNADPDAELQQLSAADNFCSGNLRPMIQMAKAWQSHCSVPLKSFYLELLMTEFLVNYSYREYGYFWYDWFFRDFLHYLMSKTNGTVTVPGTGEVIEIGDAWRSKAITAAGLSLSACEYEYKDLEASAGLDWQRIFGSQIPL